MARFSDGHSRLQRPLTLQLRDVVQRVGAIEIDDGVLLWAADGLVLQRVPTRDVQVGQGERLPVDRVRG